MKTYSKDWELLVQKYVRRLRLGSKINMCDAHWQDIEQLARIRTWKKSELVNLNRPIAPWIKTVVHNVYKNYLRDTFFPKIEVQKEYKQIRNNLIFAESIYKYEMVGDEDFYKYEIKEIIDYTTEFKNEKEEDFLRLLTKEETNILKLRQQGLSAMVISKQNKERYGSVQKKIYSLRKKYKELVG